MGWRIAGVSRLPILILILGSWAVTPNAFAAGIPLPGEMGRGHVVGISLGFDPTFTAGVTYAYIFRMAERPVAAEVAFSAPLALIPHGDHGTIRGGVATFAAPENSHWNGWIAAGLDLTAGRTAVSRERSTGFYVAATPGYFSRRWYAGPTVRYRKTLVTHREHTSWYRRVYPGVTDGWYRNNTGFLVLGIAGGVSVGRNLALSGLAGYKLSDDLRSYDPFVIPAAAELSMRYRF